MKSSDLTQILARDIDDRHELYALRPNRSRPKRVVSHERTTGAAGQPIHVIKFADGHTRVLSDSSTVWQGKELRVGVSGHRATILIVDEVATMTPEQFDALERYMRRRSKEAPDGQAVH